MNDAGSSREHRHLDRETIAQAALGLIDREGLGALSMRRVAAELKVDPMMLYRSVPNRDGMVRDVVGLLLNEMDTGERPGETWDATMRRFDLAGREVALRHPHAYPLVILAPRDEEPVLSWARRLMGLLAKGGLPEHRFFDVWLVTAAYSNGFLLLETAALTRVAEVPAPGSRDAGDVDLAARMRETVSGEAFERGLDLIYRGLRESFASEEPPA